MAARLAGVYLASNPDCRFLKFGTSADLAERLFGSGYVLTYPVRWRYVWAFVVPAGADLAFALEQGVLDVCRQRGLQVPRDDGCFTELVTASPAELRALVLQVAALAKIDVVFHEAPSFPRAASGGNGGAAAPSKSAARAAARVRALLPSLADVPPPALPAPAAPAPAAPAAAPGAPPPPAPLPLDADIIPDAELAVVLREELDYYHRCVLDLPPAGAPAEIPRDYQLHAAAAAAAHFGPNGPGPGRRGFFSMCCRSGKTNTALLTLERAVRPGHVSIYLSPWLPLLAQTAPKLALAGLGGPDSRFGRVLLVGSHPEAVVLPACLGGPCFMTTDPEAVRAFLADAPRHPRASLILATYWSSHLLVDALAACDAPVDFVVYDEAHHLCTRYDPAELEAPPADARKAKARGAYLRLHHFFLASAGPVARMAHHLYMTATPRRSGGPGTLHMRMPEHFGPELFRYTIAEGVKQGFVNPFRLQLLAGGFDCEFEPTPRGGKSCSWPRAVLARLVVQAITDWPDVTRLLVKCRNVTECNALRDLSRELFAKGGFPFAAEFYSVHTGGGAKRSDPRVESVSALAAPADPAAPRRVVVFQCNCLSEGVELIPVNAVFAACPMKSPTDIIQFLSRCLNPDLRGGANVKPLSRVFLPFVYRRVETDDDAAGAKDEDEPAPPPEAADDDEEDDSDEGEADAADAEAEAAALRAQTELHAFASAVASATPLERGRNWKALGNFVYVVEALLSEDPRFFNFLTRGNDPADPVVDWCVGRSLATPELSREELLRYCRFRVTHGGRGARPGLLAKNHTLRFGVFPFERALEQLRRTTATLRYPKSRDAFLDDPARQASFHGWFKRCREEYVKLRSGAPSLLEPHQAAALESLPHWREWGVYGPYPERTLLDWFEQYLEQHGGAVPVFSIGNGEQIHFDATMLQRFSGLMRLINQRDGAKGLRIDPDSYLYCRMEAICNRWGLVWRKERRGGPRSALAKPPRKCRDSKGHLVLRAPVETFIQAANERFNAEASKKDSAFMAEFFPGYGSPAYCRQEHPLFFGTPAVIPQLPRASKKGLAALQRSAQAAAARLGK